jgi:hypothetical protein
LDHGALVSPYTVMRELGHLTIDLIAPGGERLLET